MGIVLREMASEYIGLAWKFRVSPTSCDNPSHYENFLRLNAISEQSSGRGVTHVLVATNTENNIITKESEIIGFVTLRATSLVDSSDGVLYVKPSLEIAELAVDQKFERRGYGKVLVDVAIYIANHLNDHFIGIENVVLCADPKAVGFYENPKIGFGKLEDYYKILHDGWNNHCVPMYIKICS